MSSPTTVAIPRDGGGEVAPRLVLERELAGCLLLDRLVGGRRDDVRGGAFRSEGFGRLVILLACVIFSLLLALGRKVRQRTFSGAAGCPAWPDLF